jgi:hypothetical protein
MRGMTSAVKVGLVLALIALAATAFAQQPRAGGGAGGRGGGGGGRGMSAMFLESSWLALAFEIGISSDQLAKLRPAYQAAWNQRKSAFAQAQKTQNYQSLMTLGDKQKATLEAKIRQVLNGQQYSRWQKYQQQQVNRANQFRQQMGQRRPGTK